MYSIIAVLIILLVTIIVWLLFYTHDLREGIRKERNEKVSHNNDYHKSTEFYISERRKMSERYNTAHEAQEKTIIALTERVKYLENLIRSLGYFLDEV